MERLNWIDVGARAGACLQKREIGNSGGSRGQDVELASRFDKKTGLWITENEFRHVKNDYWGKWMREITKKKKKEKWRDVFVCWTGQLDWTGSNRKKKKAFSGTKSFRRWRNMNTAFFFCNINIWRNFSKYFLSRPLRRVRDPRFPRGPIAVRRATDGTRWKINGGRRWWVKLASFSPSLFRCAYIRRWWKEYHHHHHHWVEENDDFLNPFH